MKLDFHRWSLVWVEEDVVLFLLGVSVCQWEQNEIVKVAELHGAQYKLQVHYDQDQVYLSLRSSLLRVS